MAYISPVHGGLVFYEDENNKQKKEEQKQDAINAKQHQGFFQADLNINEHYNPQTSELPYEDRLKAIKAVGEEILKEEELDELVRKKNHFICYDGFEPSGRMHIAQGILRTINVNRCIKAGGIFVFWVADWFALLNNKMGGDLHKIRTLGKYFVEIWKAAGMDLKNVKFLWASEEINKRPDEYWSTVIDIARHNNLSRIKRCAQIMGRKEGDDLAASQILYPCMQCADIFFLKADVCQLGMDQRKVNMLAREYCDEGGKKVKPVVISHHMLMGLQKGQEKMSKSDPNSAIFMEDTEAQVKSKIKKAFCEEKIIVGNPVLDYTKYIVFPTIDKQFVIKRKPEFGGDLLYSTYEQLEDDFLNGLLHPGDLKNGLSEHINKLLDPVRRHFKENKYARELLETIKSWQTPQK